MRPQPEATKEEFAKGFPEEGDTERRIKASSVHQR